MEKQISAPARVVAYIDGFNLFYGMKESGWNRYYWLDVYALMRNVLPENSVLSGVKYFTARVSSPPDKAKRQSDYLEALQTTPCEIFFGKYHNETNYCRHCFQETISPKEKMTDVNIAVELMADAFQNRFDTALLVSGDSDLTPPIRAIRALFPEKQALVAFPPKRFSNELTQAATSHFTLYRSKIRDSQLPDEIAKPDGYTLKRPATWR